MKNVLIISTTEEEMLSNVNDGTNRLFINGSEIPSTDWTGTGNYTATVEGHAVTIKKIDSTDGNISLARTGDYTYEMRRRTPSGEVPDITASASVDANTGTPSVNVTKSGTDMNPNFDFAFHNLKGETGATGATGATPNVTATATVDANTGTPAVTVTKTGTAENPNFAFTFQNLKGAAGDNGDYKSLSYVNGADCKTTVSTYAASYKSGAFLALNCTTALNYPTTGNIFIEYVTFAGTGNILVRAHPYDDATYFYEMQYNPSSGTSTGWKKYRADDATLQSDMFTAQTSIADCNDTTFTGVGIVGASTLNRPADVGNYGVLVAYRRDDDDLVQLYFQISSSGSKMLYRCADTNTWKPWIKVYSYTETQAITTQNTNFEILNNQYTPSYIIQKNGFVTVNLCMKCLTTVSGSQAICNVPTGAINSFHVGQCYDYDDNNTKCACLVQGGVLYVKNAIAGKYYTICFTYPT